MQVKKAPGWHPDWKFDKRKREFDSYSEHGREWREAQDEIEEDEHFDPLLDDVDFISFHFHFIHHFSAKQYIVQVVKNK